MTTAALPALLAQLARAVGADAVPPQIAPGDWPAMLRLAERHRVTALLAATCAKSALPDPGISSQLARARLTQHARARRHTDAFGDIASALRNAEVQFLLLKGASVAQRYYATPEDRNAVDIDVLVDGPDLPRAIPAIEACEFERRDPSRRSGGSPGARHRAAAADMAMFRARDHAVLELHWRLSRNRLLPHWPVEELRRYAEILEIGGHRLPVLAPAALLFYLTCHGSRHLWFRLKWLADIDRAVRALDPAQLDEAARLARDKGCARLFHTSLALAEACFETPVGPCIARLDVHPGLLRAMHAALQDPCDVRESYSWRDASAALSNFYGRMLLRPTPAYHIELARHLLIDAEDFSDDRSAPRAIAMKFARKVGVRRPQP